MCAYTRNWTTTHPLQNSTERDHTMLKVLLIGDSIRMSYQSRVASRLEDQASVTGPSENCRFSAYTLFNLESWAPGGDFDVVHWNNGSWDTCCLSDGKPHTPLHVYLEYQQRIASILRQKTKRLIFATTTPVWPEQFSSRAVHPRKNSDIVEYNRAAIALLAPLGVEINDLNMIVSEDIKRYICDDMVHLNDAGIELCAQSVVDTIGQ